MVKIHAHLFGSALTSGHFCMWHIVVYKKGVKHLGALPDRVVGGNLDDEVVTDGHGHHGEDVVPHQDRVFFHAWLLL